MNDAPLLEEQLAYYRARAPEYDEWFLRLGRYDRGPQHRAEWFEEVGKIEAALEKEARGKEILELACGTGLWTAKLAAQAKRVVAIDGSPEAVAVNRKRLQHVTNVECHVVDLFSWIPDQRFDLVFFSFWLSHVPADRFNAFWEKVRAALKSGGSAFFADSLFEQSSTARDHAIDPSGIVRRKLNDGREFRIVKIFYDPVQLEGTLQRLGWNGWVRTTGKFFLFGSMEHARS
jgi:demethylmenaquinone methyltransferase/2-methoxy-6-polyprenyl-1,4-benzoquinol methylase